MKYVIKYLAPFSIDNTGLFLNLRIWERWIERKTDDSREKLFSAGNLCKRVSQSDRFISILWILIIFPLKLFNPVSIFFRTSSPPIMSQASGSIASRITQKLTSKEFRGYLMRYEWKSSDNFKIIIEISLLLNLFPSSLCPLRSLALYVISIIFEQSNSYRFLCDY